VDSKSTETNLGGDYEDQLIFSLLRGLSASRGFGRRDDAFRTGIACRHDHLDLEEHAIDSIGEYLCAMSNSKSGMFYFKSTLASRWVSLIRRSAEKFDLDLRFILAYRHPAAVEASFSRAFDLEKNVGLKIWARRNSEAVLCMPKSSFLLVDYDSWRSSGEAEVQAMQLVYFLHLEASVGKAELKSALESLHFPVNSENQVEPDTHISEGFRNLWRNLDAYRTEASDFNYSLLKASAIEVRVKLDQNASNDQPQYRGIQEEDLLNIAAAIKQEGLPSGSKEKPKKRKPAPDFEASRRSTTSIKLKVSEGLRLAYRAFTEVLIISVTPIYSFLWRGSVTVLVGERDGQYAQDNGYYFCKWIEEELSNKGHVNWFYVTREPDNVQEDWIKPHVIPYDSVTHRIIQGVSDIWAYTNSVRDVLSRNVRSSGVRVFLRHGVALLSNGKHIARYPDSHDVICCISEQEKDILSSKSIKPVSSDTFLVSGQPRFDFFDERAVKQRFILYCPTWRYDLKSADRKTFLESQYWRSIHSLTRDKFLLETLRAKGIKLLVRVHFNAAQHVPLSESTDVVEFSNRGNLHDQLNDCSLLITDYSSVFWDVIYQQKDVILLQEDRDAWLEERGRRSFNLPDSEIIFPIFESRRDAVQYIIKCVDSDFEYLRSNRSCYRSTYFANLPENASRTIFDHAVTLINSK